MVPVRKLCYTARIMDLSPLQHPDGVNAASALEIFAHRCVAVHQGKASFPEGACVGEDVVDIPIFSESEFGLDEPAPAGPISFLDRIRRFFNG